MSRSKFWAAEFMSFGPGVAPYTTSLAIYQATPGRFETIIPGQNFLASRGASIKATNSSVLLLVYENAALAFDAQGPLSGFAPDAAYARTLLNRYSRSKGFNNWLMSPAQTAWVANRKSTALGIMNRSASFDGIWFDMCGDAPLRSNYCYAARQDGTEIVGESGQPINPATGLLWNNVDYFAAMTDLMDAVRTYTGGVIGCNGLTHGDWYFHHHSYHLFDGLGDYIMAEEWGRPQGDPIGTFRSETLWKEDVDMLLDAEANSKTVLTMTKVWTTSPVPTQSQYDAIHRYHLASYHLGLNGKTQFSFRQDHNRMQFHPYWVIARTIGDPIGAYVRLGSGAYFRQFGNGKVLVNPTTSSIGPIALGGSYTDLDGNSVSSVTLAAHTGNLYILNPSGPPVPSPTKLAITSVNSGANPKVGQPFFLVVQSEDAGGSPANVLADTAVVLTRQTGTGALGGTLTGTIPAGQHQLTISGITYDTAEAGVSIHVARTSGYVLTAANSATFTVDAAPAAPTKLAITSVNAGADPAVGTAFSIVLESQDGGSNPADVGASTNISLSVQSGTGALSGTTTATIPAGTHQRTVTGILYDTAEAGVVIRATRTSGDVLTAGDSASFTVDATPPPPPDPDPGGGTDATPDLGPMRFEQGCF